MPHSSQNGHNHHHHHTLSQPHPTPRSHSLDRPSPSRRHFRTASRSTSPGPDLSLKLTASRTTSAAAASSVVASGKMIQRVPTPSRERTRGGERDGKVEQEKPFVMEYHGAGTRFVCGEEGMGLKEEEEEWESLPEGFDSLLPADLVAVRSADELLTRGIGDFNFVQGDEGILGKGKFSTVFKVHGPKDVEYALKHTALYPHHPLIAARLLREPTLLAQLPPHPCLIGVQGYLKTPDHIYLVEQLSRRHQPLSDVQMPVGVRWAGRVLDQLVSVLRDGLHRGGRVCHRDLKTENILVDEDANILLLDLGLATHFSLSEPRLTTCCGSPAFHSPEIVDALAHPPGARSYYGPELDIWCTGLTILSLLTGRKYPIGTTHRDLSVMAEAVTECLQEADGIISERGRRSGDVEGYKRDWEDWQYISEAVERFLDIDGERRMEAFLRYEVGRYWENDVAPSPNGKEFKTVSFERTEVKHPLPLFLTPGNPEQGEKERSLLMANAENVSMRNAVSYIKYLLRTAGILYHCGPSNPRFTLLQCVITLPADSPHIPHANDTAATWSISQLFNKRSASVPAKGKSRSDTGRSSRGQPETRRKRFCLRFWLRIRSGPGGGAAFPFGRLDEKIAGLAAAEAGKANGNTLGIGRPAISRHASSSGRAESAAAKRKELKRTASYGGKVAEGNKRSLSKIRTMPSDILTREGSPSSSPTYTHMPRSGEVSPNVASPSGSPYIIVDLSDARAKEAVKAALDQSRWQSLGLEALTLSPRSTKMTLRNVSGSTDGKWSPARTPTTDMSEDEGAPAPRGRGRNQESRKRNDLIITTIPASPGESGPIAEDNIATIASNRMNNHIRPYMQDRRSQSLQPSPPEIRLKDERVNFPIESRDHSIDPAARLRPGLL